MVVVYGCIVDAHLWVPFQKKQYRLQITPQIHRVF
jgi:hypothetical protein